ncbi:MAG: LysM peptidoglycan-binding domain-containing protein, partial [Acetobacteraceae bacterium]|nr:LysM peptidoglycan-binding domain-containing protein [Acetobacteraceae bacterium]
PRVLQGPAAVAPPETTAGRGSRLGLDIVDYEAGGEIRFAGNAPPGARLRLYVGREHVGDAEANAAGRWQFTPEGQPQPGQHLLRVDQLGTGGATVAARIEVPFRRERLADTASLEPGSAVQHIVQPGHSLWRIARQVYGRGTRFTLIYDANRDQIRDPRRIYPGQVLGLPGASAPAASSLSR